MLLPYSTYLIDLDGVVYRGETLVPGAREFITWLETNHKKYLFPTNNSFASETQVIAKLARLGITTDSSHVLGAGQAAVQHIAHRLQPQQPPRPMPGPPPGRNVPPPQNGYMGNPAPVGWQQQQGPLVLSNRAAAGYGYGPPPSMRDVSAGKRAHKKKRFPVWFTAIAAVLLVGIAVGGYFAMPYINIVSSSTGQTATQFGGTSTGKKGSAAQITNTDSGPLLSKPTNILLLGSDTDAKFDGTYLAQTDIVVRIDPTTKYVGMLSIPRDLQVDIPGYGASKLDIAFSAGYQSKKTSNPYADAAGLSIATIEQNFGIPIDGYAWVGLDGFIKVIDTAGGVDVDVLHPMVDDTYPDDVNAATGQTHADLQASFGYKRLYIAPGPQHFNGIEALEYVRTRHSDLVGDFGRSVRQQQVLDQLKTKLETPDTVAKLPELATDLNGYVKTSLSLSDLASLANFARTINSSSIDRLVLGPPYSVAIPNSSNFAPVCDKIIPAIQKMFELGTEANCIPQASANTAGVASSRPPANSTTNQSTATANTSEPMTSTVVMSQLAQTNMLSVGSTHGDPFGIESLTDLTLMVALESFDAMTIT